MRFFVMRSIMNAKFFSQELLEAAKAGLERLYNTKNKMDFLLEHAKERFPQKRKHC